MRIKNMSHLIQDMLDGNDNKEETIPLDKYPAHLLKLVFKYCEIVDYKDEDYI